MEKISMRSRVVGAVLTLALTGAIGQSAVAGVVQEINAGDEVQRVLDKRYPAWSFTASCRQVTRHYFTCSFFGTRGSKFADGRASVREHGRRYRATILSFRTS
jgi:hypothetical protein